MKKNLKNLISFLCVSFLLSIHVQAIAQRPVDAPIAPGLYKIKVLQTGKYLAIEGISTAIGARLVQWDYVSQNNHKFYITKNADGSYFIAAKHSGKYLSANQGYKQDGDLVIQNVLPEQLGKWKFNFSKQQGCVMGWKINYSNSLQGLHLVGTGNGAYFELRTPKQQDADTDCSYTFIFEKLEELVTDRQPSEKIKQ